MIGPGAFCFYRKKRKKNLTKNLKLFKIKTNFFPQKNELFFMKKWSPKVKPVPACQSALRHAGVVLLVLG